MTKNDEDDDSLFGEEALIENDRRQWISNGGMCHFLK